MDASTLEEIAITTLESNFQITGTITPHLSKNDKTPSWDGELFAYNSSKKTKDNLLGVCKVQVKGKNVSHKELTKKKIQYKVFLSDLNNYRFNGGIIFFVVGITESYEHKIYYKTLLPYDLALIISEKKKQKTTTILLKEMPTDINKIVRLIYRFIRDSRSQYSTTPLHPIGMTEYLTRNDEKNVLSCTVDFPDIFDTSTWLYSSQKTQLHIKEPIGKIRIIEMGFKDPSLKVYIFDRCYFDIVTVGKRANGFSMYLGECIEISLEQDGKADCKFMHKGDIDSVLKGLRFYLAFIRCGEIRIVSESLGEQIINIGSLVEAKKHIDDIESDIESYTYIKELLLRLNVRKPIKVNDFSKSDLHFLLNMYKCIVKKEVYKASSDMPIGIKVYQVGKLILAFVFLNQKDTSCWLDYFDCKEFTLTGKDEKGNEFKSSFFLRLQRRQFLEWDNINYYAIEKSIKEITINDFNCANTNMLILEMLSAYDESPNSELLQSAINISKHLQESRHEIVYILNYYQAIRRQRSLHPDEREQLIMLRNQECDNATLAGISAILGNKEDYEIYLSKLPTELRQQFISFPINNLVSNKGV